MACAPPAVLFDWDGTLLDSAEATYRCYVRLFGTFGIAFGRADYERTYSPDWRRTYEDVGIPRARWDEADALWRVYYHEQPPDLIAGVACQLTRLQRGGHRLGLVTSGERTRVLADLERLAVRDRFEAVVCGGDTPERKPHPAPLCQALRVMTVSPGQAAFVGDSPEDVRMAQAAGVQSVAIPGGFPNHGPLAAAGADISAPDLASALTRLGVR